MKKSSEKTNNKKQTKNSKKQTKSEILARRRIIAVIGGVLLLLLMIVPIIVGVKKLQEKMSYTPYYNLEERNSKIQETNIEGNQAYAWLRVQGTDIDTPIIPITSSLNSSFADYLWTSGEYVEGENRKVIYGHNIRNVSSYPDITNPGHNRFEQLVSFAYYDFAKENLYIQYNDGKEENLYKIYAVTFNNEADEYGQSYVMEDVADYIHSAKYNSVYNYDVDVKDTDELIALITCTRYFGAYEKTQFRVDARKVRKNEKILKYNVETTSNYDIIK